MQTYISVYRCSDRNSAVLFELRFLNLILIIGALCHQSDKSVEGDPERLMWFCSFFCGSACLLLRPAATWQNLKKHLSTMCLERALAQGTCMMLVARLDV